MALEKCSKEIGVPFLVFAKLYHVRSNGTVKIYIRKTCPCNVYPLKPHFYIVKMGYAGVYIFFLFLLQNIDCVPTIYVLSKIKKNVEIFTTENFILTT